MSSVKDISSARDLLELLEYILTTAPMEKVPAAGLAALVRQIRESVAEAQSPMLSSREQYDDYRSAVGGFHPAEAIGNVGDYPSNRGDDYLPSQSNRRARSSLASRIQAPPLPHAERQGEVANSSPSLRNASSKSHIRELSDDTDVVRRDRGQSSALS